MYKVFKYIKTFRFFTEIHFFEVSHELLSKFLDNFFRLKTCVSLDSHKSSFCEILFYKKLLVSADSNFLKVDVLKILFQY